MLHRLALVSMVVVGLAACGSETVDAGGSDDAISYPTASDQAVISLSRAGGFVPEGADFRTPPELVIEGDGSVFRPGAQIAIFPAPLLPAITVAPLDQEGIEMVLAAADEAGLLQEPPSYEPGEGATQVTDVPTTVLVIQANGETFRHEAYALGFEPSGQESTPERAALDGFVRQLQDLPSLVGDHLGPDEISTPERFGVIARPATPEELAPTGDGIEPSVVPWPEAAGELASMSQCTEVAAGDVGETFENANDLTRFSQGGTDYVVFVRVLLPNETCAAFQ